MLKELSIIMPYHDSMEYTKKLLDVLIPQLNDKCEVIIVDDDVNTYELDKYVSNNIKVIHHNQNSGGASKPRNTGLDNKTRGSKFVFIDSDDMIIGDYILTIIEEIENNVFDYCLFSWKFNNIQKDEIIITDNPPDWNYSVWNCIYSETDERFNEELRVGEDLDFNLRVRKGKKENITKILYLYNDNRVGSIMNGDKDETNNIS